MNALAPAYRGGSELDRACVCPWCLAAHRAPGGGGNVTCSKCGATFVVPGRHEWRARPLDVPMPRSDAARLAELRAQDGRPRVGSDALKSVLGGPGVQAGREQEALLIWQSLRARAEQRDVAAGEDLSVLTILLFHHPFVSARPNLSEGLAECAFDAVVLPRHKQEQLGLLVRAAAGRGDLARAQRYLSWMAIDAPDLEADSDHRICAAVIATLDRDPHRVLALLGPQKDAVPIADSTDPLASVFRAHAFELLGDVARAQAALGELPDAGLFERTRQRFPALALCAQSGSAYAARVQHEGARRAEKSAGFIGRSIAPWMIFSGAISAGATLFTRGWGRWDFDQVVGALMGGGLGLVFIVIGVVLLVRGRSAGKRAAALWTHGLALSGRVVGARTTGTKINDVPLCELTLQIAGPRGPYQTAVRRLVPEYELPAMLGREVRVRADPAKLDEVVLEG
jgi:hypothetical protein